MNPTGQTGSRCPSSDKSGYHGLVNNPGVNALLIVPLS
jgi:hypothetical protein